MRYYSTSEVAKIAGIHPNTVRFYEKMSLISEVPRKANGYRVFNAIHIEQIKLIKIAFQCEIIQGDLRKSIVNIVKSVADKDYYKAVNLVEDYKIKLNDMKDIVLKSVEYIKTYNALNKDSISKKLYKKTEILKLFNISSDTLRNWERNSLIIIPRGENGRTYYTDEEIKKLTIISSLRYANYSIMGVLKFLKSLEKYNDIDTYHIIEQTEKEEDIIYVTDRIFKSLCETENNISFIKKQIEIIKNITLQ